MSRLNRREFLRYLIALPMVGALNMLTGCSTQTPSTQVANPTDVPTSAPGAIVPTTAPPEAATTDVPQSTTGTDSAPEPTATTEPVEVVEDEGQILVTYFSRTGNTETVANMIAGATGATLFRIEPVIAYPEDYDECLDVAMQEQNASARPEIVAGFENIHTYDTVFVGYPNWWGTMPMALFTFLEGHDLSGKTIIPFCTHEGSALGRSERDLAALFPNQTILDGLAIRGPRAGRSESNVLAWLEGLDIPLG